VGQIVNRPGGSAEEVGEAVERVPHLVIDILGGDGATLFSSV